MLALQSAGKPIASLVKARHVYSLRISEIRLGDSATERITLCIEFWSGWDCESWTSVPRAIINLQSNTNQENLACAVHRSAHWAIRPQNL